jgi:DNA-binding NarL/FixJ family response regulator
MKTILIAEDERIVSLELTLELKQSGFMVLKSVSTGEELIHEALLLKPDIILTDIRLHDSISGIEAVKKVKSSLDSFVIVMSAYNDPVTLKEVEKLNPDAFLFKPLNAGMIISVLEKSGITSSDLKLRSLSEYKKFSKE